ncbi:MAG TPA: ferritin-like domain-containing protein [Longimicrobiales bacterium]|nr:ferritin-like domain-containing protein [Longimicrobiales bacterium]
MQISTMELNRLNFYRACELHGGLVLGQLVRRSRDADLILMLTRHAADELTHAQLWTETIVALGGQLQPVESTYQARLGRIVGAPGSLFQVVALSHVIERRVLRHFTEHARLPETHPIVRAALERTIEEEKEHLSCMSDWLQLEAERRCVNVRDVLNRFALADARVYGELINEYGFRTAA